MIRVQYFAGGVPVTMSDIKKFAQNPPSFLGSNGFQATFNILNLIPFFLVIGHLNKNCFDIKLFLCCIISV